MVERLKTQEQLRMELDTRVKNVVYKDRSGEEIEITCQDFSVEAVGPDSLTIMWLGDVIEISPRSGGYEVRREIIGYTCGIQECDLWILGELWEEHIKKINDNSS